MISDIIKNHDIQSLPGKSPLIGCTEKAVTNIPLDKLGIDREAALERTMGDEKFLLELLQEFIDSLSEIKKRIQKAIHQKDPSAVAEEASRLAGAAGNLGAVRLSDAAYGLEKIGRNGPMENAPNAFQQLVLEADKLISRVGTSAGNVDICSRVAS